jgi:hypothetical protein
MLPTSRDDGAGSTYETSVNFYQTTWRNSPEHSHLHTRRRENLKSHIITLLTLLYLEKGQTISQDVSATSKLLEFVVNRPSP